MKPFVTALALCLLLATAPRAADPDKGKLAPGDKVEVEWAGQKVQAEFVKYFGNGWLTVKFTSNGVEMTPTLPPDQVRVLGRGGAAGGAAPKRPLRTWTDTTGKFKTKARFVELRGDEVTLETDKGKSITIPLEKLSESDRAMARKIAAKTGKGDASPADGDGDPFAGGTDRPDGMPAAPAAPQEGDWSGCRTVVAAAPEGWSLPPDPIEMPAVTKPQPVVVAGAGGQGSVFEKPWGLLVARQAGKGFLVSSDRPPAKPAVTTLQPIDLTRGKSSAPLPFDSTLLPVDVTSGGDAILARAEQMFATGLSTPALGVWRIGERAPERIALWNPKKPGDIHDTPPSHAAFIDADHVVCVSFPGTLSVWNVPATKALWSLGIDNGTTPATSPGGRYLAAVTGGAVHFFEALTGETLARLPGAPPPGARLSFRPDCGRLAAVSSQRLMVWDLATGSLERDVAFAAAINTTSIEWPEPGYVLLGGHDLVDLDRRVVLWRYLHDAGNPFVGNHGQLGGTTWSVVPAADQRSRILLPAKLPHPAARAVAKGLDPERLLAVRPGTSLAIDLRIQGAADEQERVRQALAARLGAAGLVPAAAAPLVVQAVTETGKTQEISYRSFGSLDRSVEKATVTDQISRVMIWENNAVIWESTAVRSAPFSLQMKADQTVQDALAPYQKPYLDYFTTVELPPFLARSGPGGAYGFSQLTAQGIVDTQAPAAAPPR